MKLVREVVLPKMPVDLIDSVRGDQRRPFGALGDEVAERAGDRTGHQHVLPARREEREVPIDLSDTFRVSIGNAGPRFVEPNEPLQHPAESRVCSW